MKRIFIFLLIICATLVQAQKKTKVGLCLSGGAALGYAHIGVLQALEENGIKPDVISGSSMGAIIGVLYASGIKPLEMLDIIKKEKLYKTTRILHFSDAQYGLSSHSPLRKLISEIVPNNSFDSLQTPLYVCVSNLNNAKWKIVNRGDSLTSYIIASASIPGVFEPITIGDSAYVDGGLYNNLPAQVLKGKCDYIIGVDVLPYIQAKKITSTLDVVMLSIRGIEHNNSISGRNSCDFLIEPSGVKTFDEMSFEKYQELYKIGYDETIEFIKNNPKMSILSRKANSKKAL